MAITFILCKKFISFILKDNIYKEMSQSSSRQVTNKQQNISQNQDQDHQQLSSLSQIDSLQIDMATSFATKLNYKFKRGNLSQFKKHKDISKFLTQMSHIFKHKKINKQQRKKQTKQQRKEKLLKRTQITRSYMKKQRIKSVTKNMVQLKQILQKRVNQQIQDNNVNQFQLKCYICKASYKQIHDFYGSLCPICAKFNLQKRNQTANLTGKTALVTGGRIKIGYQICLKLLRDGATVYSTTRFPHDALQRYQKQQDYQIWKNRLFLLQCDFLSENQVRKLINYIKKQVVKLDILINNAAQTLVRPKQFYTLELQKQMKKIQNSKNQNHSIILFNQINENIMPSIFSNEISINPGQIDIQNLDQFGQPTDKRQKNTWIQKIQQVSLLDCYTTQVINSIVPFHIIGQLKQNMKGQSPSWIINVSSMEGIFYRATKQQYHPHTNMAKASLNMITRTCAHQYRLNNIYMTSVDTGWVTNQNPHHVAQKMKKQYLWNCPLDVIDGAMRVLDPIYIGVNQKIFPYGVFLKDYKQSYW